LIGNVVFLKKSVSLIIQIKKVMIPKNDLRKWTDLDEKK